MLSRVTPLLERNDESVGNGASQNTTRFADLCPSRACTLSRVFDPRADPAELLGLEFSEAIVARTVGGRVTDAIIQDLSSIGCLVEIFDSEGPYFEAAVIHHTDCSSRLLDKPVLRHRFADRSRHGEEMLASLPTAVSRESVKADIDKILLAPQVSSHIKSPVMSTTRRTDGLSLLANRGS